MYNVSIMTFGYQQGGSFTQHKQALGNDAAASEQMRLKQAMEQKKREEKMRAKQDIQSKGVKLRIIKDELNMRESESRRLDFEIHKISGERAHVDSYDQKIRELKQKQMTRTTEISEMQRKIDKIKIELKDVDLQISKISSEKAYSEKTANNKSRELTTLEERKRHEDSESSRLKEDELKLENEIKALERIAV